MREEPACGGFFLVERVLLSFFWVRWEREYDGGEDEGGVLKPERNNADTHIMKGGWESRRGRADDKDDGEDF